MYQKLPDGAGIPLRGVSMIYLLAVERGVVLHLEVTQDSIYHTQRNEAHAGLLLGVSM